MFGKKRVLRKNLRDMEIMNVPMNRRQENMNTSAVYIGVLQPLPNSTPFNSLHLLRLNADQSVSSPASVPFAVLLSETAHQTALLLQVASTTWAE